MSRPLPSTADDGWDMSPRRESAVVLEMPTSFETFDAVKEKPILREKLSSAEIEALLRPDLSDMAPEPAPLPPAKVVDRAIPDLDTPAVLTPRTDVPEDALRVAARLSLALRQGCGLRAAATVKAVSDGTFASALATSTVETGQAIACFAAPNGEIVAMLNLSAELANALIESACGGKPGAYTPRELTPVDAALLEGLVRPLGAGISSSLSFARIETDAEFAAALARPGAVDVIDLDVRFEQSRMPARLILASDDLFDTGPVPGKGQGMVTAAPANAPNTAPVTAVLTARIASLSVPLSRLTDLKAGSTLLLGLPADQPVELLSGGRNGPVAAEAQIGRKGAHMALRITKRGPALR
ncbi:FliM/FliN family flagellar motor switch protein [Hyphomonas oceanitis]|uniref:FliM/FliN family flagellar motor switch protein n=1 Tax=Hyphomonas oceanitis TaxID=81033 RepID=UPI003001FF3F